MDRYGVVGDEGKIDEPALQPAGVQGVKHLPNRVLHLIVGLNAGQLAG